MAAAPVTVYTAGFCGYCIRVTSLLARRGIAFTEVSVEDHPGLREELLAKSGRRTLPQVYVGGRFVGGADEIAAMDRGSGLPGFLQSED
ncbi:MAG TPA: glutaredoxin [Steroidobacteraceae bacterium]|jgi:glutaredoxin 3